MKHRTLSGRPVLDWKIARTKNSRQEFTARFSFRAGVSQKALAEATRGLAVLVEARLPLVRAIAAVAGQAGGRRLQGVLGAVKESVQGGSSLSDALKEHPKIFSALYVHLVEVGETVGSLGPVLRRLADHLERTRALRRKARLAMVYPGLILTVAVGAVSFMLTVIVPTFAEMFEGFGAELPAATRHVIAASDVLTSNLLLITALLMSLIFGGRAALGTEAVRARWDPLKLRTPLIGPLLRKALAARFCRTLGTLLGRGVPLTDALELLSKAIGNVAVEAQVQKMHHALERGATLSSRLGRSEAFPPLLRQMILVGEETARLDEVLLHTATLYEEELDAQVETLTSIIEPVLILVIGILLGIILIALYLPMFDMVTVVG